MDTIQERYINLFTDFGFKKLFGTEFNKPLLIDFLNEVIGKESGRIEEISFIPNEQLPQIESDRKAIFDIYCTNDKGEKFIVEMQKAKQKYFKDRSVYYSTFPIQQQAEKGDWNFKLKAVYTIALLDFIFEDHKEELDTYHHEVKMVDLKTHKVFYDKLTYIYLEMPKFNKTEEELETHFDKWLFILKNLHKLTSQPVKLQEQIFNTLFETSDIKKFTKVERDTYHESLKQYRDLKNSIDTAYGDGYDEAVEMMDTQVKKAEEGKKKADAIAQKAEAKAQKAEEGKQKAEVDKLKLIEALKSSGMSSDDIQKFLNS